ncbi:MAG: hypothetical protein ACOCRO_04735 [Halanaerobiales bacterium]
MLLSEEYKNNKTKLDIMCPAGHVHSMILNSFKSGQRCPYCSGNVKYTYKQVKNYIEYFEYSLLSKDYKNKDVKLKVKCPYGHEYRVTFGNFKSGYRCLKCYKEKKYYNLEKIKTLLNESNYKLLSSKYDGIFKKLKMLCPEGHEFEMSLNAFLQGQRCSTCFRISKSSKAEKEIYEYILDTFNIEVIKNDRNTIINPLTGSNLELDIYLPQEKKAIEYNGTYWHSLDVAIEHDKIKKDQCKENNIDLLIINEND